MKVYACVFIAMSALLGVARVLAADNPLIGQWEARTPERPGETVTFTFGPTHMEMTGEQPVPYRTERKGNVVTLFVQGGEAGPPGVITLVSENEITMQFPGGPEIHMTRLAARGESQAAKPGREPTTGRLGDEITAALLPHGVPTKFEPLGQSLEQLLGAGWTLVQMSSAQGGFSVWLRNGATHAVCIVVPNLFDDSGGALSDCRRLN